MSQRCKSKNARGQPCSAYPVAGSPYCFMHDPARAPHRAASRRLGGYHRRRYRNPVPFPAVDTRTSAGLMALVEEALHETWALENSIHRVRALGYLTQIQKALVETSILEQRLAALESVLKSREEEK